MEMEEWPNISCTIYRVNPFGQEQRRAGVAEVVEPDVGEAAPPLNPLEAGVYDVPAPPGFARVVGEYEAVVPGPSTPLAILLGPVLAEGIHRNDGKGHAPTALSRFRGHHHGSIFGQGKAPLHLEQPRV